MFLSELMCDNTQYCSKNWIYEHDLLFEKRLFDDNVTLAIHRKDMAFSFKNNFSWKHIEGVIWTDTYSRIN